jgi:Fe2+ or Zn2+ uptake regulation protein
MNAQMDWVAGYFDTTELPANELSHAKAVTACQNAQVLAIFREHGRPLTPSQVWRYGCDDGLGWLLTSVRRSMSVLTEADALVKLETKRGGAYGRPEFEWALAITQ